jgi:hypothetical protein
MRNYTIVVLQNNYIIKFYSFAENDIINAKLKFKEICNKYIPQSKNFSGLEMDDIFEGAYFSENSRQTAVQVLYG